MNARDNTPLRTLIAMHLDEAGESPATKIAKAVGKGDYPSVVVRELNLMRTEGLVECEQRKTVLIYWLAVPLTQIVAAQQPESAQTFDMPDCIKPGTRGAQVWGVLRTGRQLTAREVATALKCPSGTLDPLLGAYVKDGTLDRHKGGDGIYRYHLPINAAPQPEVGQNTGSSASDVTSTTTPAEGAAVHQPAPAAAEVKAAAPAAADDTDEEMPPADPALLASANRMLSERLEGVAHALRGSGLPALRTVTSGEDLQPHVAALSGAYQMAAAKANEQDSAVQQYVALKASHASYELEASKAHMHCTDADVPPGVLSERVAIMAEDWRARGKSIAKLRAELAAERQAREALQEQLDAAKDVKDAATGYLVKAPKRRPRVITKPESARAAALAAAKSAGRADVLALVPVGRAVRGAEWREVKP